MPNRPANRTDVAGVQMPFQSFLPQLENFTYFPFTSWEKFWEQFFSPRHYCPVKNLGNSIGYRLVQLRNSRPRERMPSGSRSFQKPPPKRPAAMCREAPPAGAVCARSQPAHRPKRSVLPVFMTNPSPRHRRGEPPAIQIRPSNEVLKTIVCQTLTRKLGSTNRTL